jgi:hypothetical protein
VKVNKWTDEQAIYADGDWFTRGQVVDYMRNKAGGAHLGSDLPHEHKLDKWLIDYPEMVFNQSPVHLEVLGMAQTLVEAPDTGRLLGELGNRPPDDQDHSRWQFLDPGSR